MQSAISEKTEDKFGKVNKKTLVFGNKSVPV